MRYIISNTILAIVALSLFSCVSEKNPTETIDSVDSEEIIRKLNALRNEIEAENKAKNNNESEQTTSVVTASSFNPEDCFPKYLYSEEDYKDVDPYLITNKGAGYFWVGGIISDFPSLNYDYYDSEETILVGGDADDSAGMELRKGEETMMVLEYERSVFSEDLKDFNCDKSKLYLVPDGNTAGWYFRNTINKIYVVSTQFKTEKGIGVGSTIGDMLSKYEIKSLREMYLGEYEVALVMTPELPNIVFEIEAEGLTKRGKENFNDEFEPENGENFKSDAKVTSIRIRRTGDPMLF